MTKQETPKTVRQYQPRQRTDGRWEYVALTLTTRTEGATTIITGGETHHVVGYCAGWHYDDGTPLDEQAWAKERAEVLHLKGKYHDGGHDSDEKARRCFNEFLLDRLKVKEKREQQPCTVCGKTTPRVVILARLYRWPICTQHDARTATRDLLMREPAVRTEGIPLEQGAPFQEKQSPAPQQEPPPTNDRVSDDSGVIAGPLDSAKGRG